MRAFPSLIPFFVLLAVGAGTVACTSRPEPLAPTKPVLPKLVKEGVSEIIVNARPPGTPAWRARLVRGKSGWEVAERSDDPGERDLADAALVDHLLDLLSTFVADEKIDSSSDSVLGLTPYRAEIRIRSSSSDGKKTESTLLFGNPVGDGRLYFRRENDDQAWTGRGGLLLFFENMRTADFFVWKMPYLGAYEDISRVEVEKRLAPGANRWSFRRDRNNGRWTYSESDRPLSPESGSLLERILRQRFLKRIPKDSETGKGLPKEADWRFLIGFGDRPSQTLEIYFSVDGIFAQNPARSEDPMELYPEFAGALRAFTQSRFTPVKSRTK